MFSTLKSGVHVAAEHESITMATIAATLMLMIPSTRRLVWRMTFGRFQSAESAFAAAEKRFANLQESINMQTKDSEKLLERFDAAKKEYERGLSKLTDTAAEYRRLAGRAESTERKAQGEFSKI